MNFDDEFTLPFDDTLDWSLFSFTFSAWNVPHAPAILSSVSETQWTKMHVRSLAVYEHFLSAQTTTIAAIEILRRRIANAVSMADVSLCP